MIQEQIQKLVNQLIQIEHVSTTLYLAMSAYMDRLNLRGMAHWLRIQSEEERNHMIKLINYLNDRGGTVEIQAMPTQPINFGTPLETFQKVLAHEQYVTNSYRQAYDFVKQIDQQTAVIIQEFLREQIEEEAQSQTIVDRLQLAQNNPAAILLIDQELGRRERKTAAGG